MASCDFHLHFVSQSQTFDIDFQERKHPSIDTVRVNGRNYALLGDAFEIDWLKAKLPELSEDGLSFKELRARLIKFGTEEISATAKTHHIGIDFFVSHIPIDATVDATATTFSETKQKGQWMSKDLNDLPKKRRMVADKYWSVHSERFRKIAKAEKHLEKLKRQRDSAGKGKAGRSKKVSVSTQIEIHEKRLAELKKPDAMFVGFLKGSSTKSKIIG